MTPGPASTSAAALSAAVVICAYTEDRWDLLRAAVQSAQAQSVRPERVVVCVDHNDALAVRCEQHWPREGQPAGAPPVVVVRNRYAGRLGSARNTAAEQVSADVIAFLDDDAAADPDWLVTLLRAYDDGGAVAVGGAPRPVFQTERPCWFPPEFDWVFGCHYAGLPERRAPVRHLIGASMSVRTDALRAIGGFRSDNHDDMDLSHRIAAAYGSAAVQYEPAACVHHFVSAQRLTWRYFWRRCYLVNRGKVRAFSDMGHAGNLGAELAFVRRTLLRIVRRIPAAITGDRCAAAQVAVIVAGFGLAGLGHLVGRVELRLGLTPDSPTIGLGPREGA
ncbi:MAG: glycosyltransferase [Mycobacteriales bacterium]